MAMQDIRVILGIDVSQDWIDVCEHGIEAVERVENGLGAVRQMLDRYPTAALAVEATNTYHETVVEEAYRRGLAVYVVSGYQLKHYANSLGQRMRNDAVDAQLLARFLAREIDQLRPYEPRPPQQIEVRRLLKRRALLRRQQVQLRQSFKDLPGLAASVKSLLKRLNEVVALIDKRLLERVVALGWQADFDRLLSIPGVGPLTAVALLETYHSGQFNHRDAFIAFLGLDVRTKDSGKHRGKRQLSKQGNPEARRLLFNAAMASIKQRQYFRPVYEALQARGKAKIQALVIISRKIARLGFALLRNQQRFDPELHRRVCLTT